MSAAMLALAKELHGSAPVWVTDTEPGWQFLRPMFSAEGVKLKQRTVTRIRERGRNARSRRTTDERRAA